MHRAAEIPSAEAYVFALSQPFVKMNHRRMLLAHREAAGMVMTAGALSAAAGCFRHSYANLHYGQLGRHVAEHLGIRLPLYSKGPLMTAAIAEGWHEAGGPSGTHWRWRLYPQVAEAIDVLKRDWSEPN